MQQCRVRACSVAIGVDSTFRPRFVVSLTAASEFGAAAWGRFVLAGCGDAFQAAFTVAYAGGASIVVALHRGAKQAAIVVQQYGAI